MTTAADTPFETLSQFNLAETDDGYLLEPAITIPQDATKVSISKTGLVQVTQAGQPAPTTVGLPAYNAVRFRVPAGASRTALRMRYP